jgi:uncharacterized protein (DUF488 family)|tara:strand:- start:137 stop:619 length:483 start_codon:yes stop_codon:yes gene_type:complete
MKNIFTIGVYGLTNEEFFGKLIENHIDTFCDIRRRRGVRGSKYSFVNSKRLQAKLSELGISYVHILDLSPTKEIREKQKEEDKRLKILKRERTGLGDAFIKGFIDEHLNNFNPNDFYKMVGGNANNVVLFCVEKEHNACHRSLVSNFLKENDATIQIVHL